MSSERAPSLRVKDKASSKTNGGLKYTSPPPSPRTFSGFSEITNFIWSFADLLRGDYKQADYGKVILPLTVLRRLDCVLEKTKTKVLAKHDELKKAKQPEAMIEKLLVRAAGVPFYNVSRLDFERLKGEPGKIAANLTSYIKGFSANARDVIEQFVADAKEEKCVADRAKANSLENFELVMKDVVADLVVARMDRNKEIADAYFNEPEFGARLFKAIVRRVYEEIRTPGSPAPASR